MDTAWSLIVLPLGLGLLGFVEPCSIGASLLFLKSIEGKPVAAKLTQAAVFMLTRALFIGALGGLAALIGSAFLGLQRSGWVVLGVLYLLLGLAYLTGHAGRLMLRLGPSLSRLTTVRGAGALGLLFGLNIPACAAPLLAALLGSAAVAGASQFATGFVMLAVFGLALSLPLVAALLWEPARRALDWLLAHAGRRPLLIGLLFAVFGLWSIWFGLFARL